MRTLITDEPLHIYGVLPMFDPIKIILMGKLFIVINLSHSKLCIIYYAKTLRFISTTKTKSQMFLKMNMRKNPGTKNTSLHL